MKGKYKMEERFYSKFMNGKVSVELNVTKEEFKLISTPEVYSIDDAINLHNYIGEVLDRYLETQENTEVTCDGCDMCEEDDLRPCYVK